MLKSQQVTQFIESKLEAAWSGGTGPYAISRLGRELNVNYRTIRRGLQPLLRQGRIQVVRGQGIIPVDREGEAQGFVALGVLSEGHFYADLYRALISELTCRGYSAIAVDSQHPETQAAERAITSTLALKPKASIIDGLAFFKHPHLHRLTERRCVFINCFDSPNEMPGPGVFLDYRAGMAEATLHLVAMGHRRIAFAGHQRRDDIVCDPRHRTRNPSFEAECGYAEAMNLAGLGAVKQSFWQTRHDGASSSAVLEALMRGTGAPTAFVCQSDFCAAEMMREFTRIGVRVPDDAALVGFYNTPWACCTSPALSSLDPRAAELAELAVRLAVEHTENEGEPVVYRIAPRLIVRHSSDPSRQEKGCGT